MKAPISHRVQDILSDKEESEILMTKVLEGERNESKIISHKGKTFSLKRVLPKGGSR